GSQAVLALPPASGDRARAVTGRDAVPAERMVAPGALARPQHLGELLLARALAGLSELTHASNDAESRAIPRQANRSDGPRGSAEAPASSRCRGHVGVRSRRLECVESLRSSGAGEARIADCVTFATTRARVHCDIHIVVIG